MVGCRCELCEASPPARCKAEPPGLARTFQRSLASVTKEGSTGSAGCLLLNVLSRLLLTCGGGRRKGNSEQRQSMAAAAAAGGHRVAAGDDPWLSQRPPEHCWPTL